jgi:NADH pyrophosphatase NudC (nudix superfamily)
MPEVSFCPICGTRMAPVTHEGRERPGCPAAGCGYVHWDNPVPVVAAIIEHEGQVLLARNAAWGPKMFGLVTGFLERDEAPDAAVLREVKEEVGLEGKIRELVGVYPFFMKNQVIIIYHVETTGQVTLGDEIAEVKLLPHDKVRPWPMGTGPALAEWLERRRSSR